MTRDEEPGGGVAPLLAFGDDGSPGADVAWLWINNHHWPGWAVEVLTANPAFPPTSWGPLTPTEWAPPWGRSFFHHDELASLRCLTAEADPRLLLGGYDHAQLLVVAPRGLGPARSLLLGSTSEWLLHHSRAPLAVIRSAAVVEHVVVCADGSPSARRALDAFLRLPLAAATRVTVLGVYDGRADVEAAGQDSLEALEAAGVGGKAEQVRGKPAHAILEYLDEHDPQLVVLGTRGLTGWQRLRVGSTASAVVRAAHCSSLVARAEEPLEA